MVIRSGAYHERLIRSTRRDELAQTEAEFANCDAGLYRSAQRASAKLAFQLFPSRIKLIHQQLRVFDFILRGYQSIGVADDGGVFIGRTSLLELSFGFSDALFERRVLASFKIGELFLRRGDAAAKSRK